MILLYLGVFLEALSTDKFGVMWQCLSLFTAENGGIEVHTSLLFHTRNAVPSSSNSASSSWLNVWDAIGAPTVGPKGDQRAITGTPAFVLWRSLYWTKLLSTRSRLSLTADWMKSLLSGRDVVEPVLKSRPTIVSAAMPRRPSVESFGTSLQRNSTVRFVKQKAEEAAVAQKKRFWIL